MINKELLAIARNHLDQLVVKQSFIPVQPNDPALVTSGGTGAPVTGPPPDPAGGQVPAELMAAMANGGGQPQPGQQPSAPQDSGGQPQQGGGNNQEIKMTIDQLTRFVAAVTGKGLPEDKHTIKQLESELKELRAQLGQQQPGGPPMAGGAPGQPPADPNQMGTMAELKAAAVSKVDNTLALEPSVRSALEALLD